MQVNLYVTLQEMLKVLGLSYVLILQKRCMLCPHSAKALCIISPIAVTLLTCRSQHVQPSTLKSM